MNTKHLSFIAASTAILLAQANAVTTIGTAFEDDFSGTYPAPNWNGDTSAFILDAGDFLTFDPNDANNNIYVTATDIPTLGDYTTTVSGDFTFSGDSNTASANDFYGFSFEASTSINNGTDHVRIRGNNSVRVYVNGSFQTVTMTGTGSDLLGTDGIYNLTVNQIVSNLSGGVADVEYVISLANASLTNTISLSGSTSFIGVAVNSDFGVGVRTDNNGGLQGTFDNFSLLTTPSVVPEPGSFALLGGLFAMASLALRRRR